MSTIHKVFEELGKVSIDNYIVFGFEIPLKVVDHVSVEEMEDE